MAVLTLLAKVAKIIGGQRITDLRSIKLYSKLDLVCARYDDCSCWDGEIKAKRTQAPIRNCILWSQYSVV